MLYGKRSIELSLYQIGEPIWGIPDSLKKQSQFHPPNNLEFPPKPYIL